MNASQAKKLTESFNVEDSTYYRDIMTAINREALLGNYSAIVPPYQMKDMVMRKLRSEGYGIKSDNVTIFWNEISKSL